MVVAPAAEVYCLLGELRSSQKRLRVGSFLLSCINSWTYTVPRSCAQILYIVVIQLIIFTLGLRSCRGLSSVSLPSQCYIIDLFHIVWSCTCGCIYVLFVFVFLSYFVFVFVFVSYFVQCRVLMAWQQISLTWIQSPSGGVKSQPSTTYWLNIIIKIIIIIIFVQFSWEK